MSTSAIKTINKTVNDHVTWLERNPFFGQNAIQEAEKAGKDPTLYSLLLLSEAMRSLGLFYGTTGIVNIYQGQTEWNELAGALDAYMWSVRLRFKFYYSLFAPERPSRRSWFLHNLPLAFCLFCHFIWVKDKQREQELWSLLQLPLGDRDSRVVDWWHMRHFEPFVVLLYRRSNGQATPFHASACDLGAYRSILEEWENASSLAIALTDACDYHLKRMENTRDWDAEFDLPPFDLVPAEIKAICVLREFSKLPPVQFDHPLMDFVRPFEAAAPPEELTDIFYLVSNKYDEFS
jgi:hypothetical protein